MARPQISDELMADLQNLRREGDRGVGDVIDRLIEENDRALRQLDQQRREVEAERLKREFQRTWMGRFESIPESDLVFLADEDQWIGGFDGPPEARSEAGQRARGLIADFGLRAEDLEVDRSEMRRLGIPPDEFTISLVDVVDGARAELDRRRHEAQGAGRPAGLLGVIGRMIAPER